MQIKTDLLCSILKRQPDAILLDPEDLEKFRFSRVYRDARGYVRLTLPTGLVYLHQAVTEFKFERVDHINGKPWDCRKENLREADKNQNMYNQGRQSPNTSGYKGVSWCSRDKKWKAQIGNKGVVLNLGRFKTAEEAHVAYCKKAKELHGEFFNAG